MFENMYGGGLFTDPIIIIMLIVGIILISVIVYFMFFNKSDDEDESFSARGPDFSNDTSRGGKLTTSNMDVRFKEPTKTDNMY